MQQNANDVQIVFGFKFSVGVIPGASLNAAARKAFRLGLQVTKTWK